MQGRTITTNDQGMRRSGMKRYLGVFLVLCAAAGSSLLPPDALATVIDLNYTSIATGVDDGPEDGVFDSFTSLNLGSVNDNGYTAFRTAAAFDLSSVPPTTTVNRTTLTVVISNFEGARSLAVHGYAGD